VADRRMDVRELLVVDGQAGVLSREPDHSALTRVGPAILEEVRCTTNWRARTR
jgi:hypothetical protein